MKKRIVRSLLSTGAGLSLVGTSVVVAAAPSQALNYGVVVLRVSASTGATVYDDAALTTPNDTLRHLDRGEYVGVRSGSFTQTTVQIEFVQRGGKWVRVTSQPGDTDYVRKTDVTVPLTDPPKPPGWGWRWGQD